MKRSFLVALTVATIVGVGLPAAAHAEPEDYTPADPATPSLAGSTAVGTCERDVPWISYDLTLVDPDAQATSNQASLVLTDGANTTTIPLGTLVDGRLSGRILWPGASTDAGGAAAGWPGWAYQNGQWVEVPDNYRWTRGDITATVVVNPELVVPLSYPVATPDCATGPRQGSVAALPATGVSQAVFPIAVAGAAALVAGGLLAFRRRSARR